MCKTFTNDKCDLCGMPKPLGYMLGVDMVSADEMVVVVSEIRNGVMYIMDAVKVKLEFSYVD